MLYKKLLILCFFILLNNCTTTTLTKNNICVSKTQLIKSEQKYNHIINEYTKLDPTLPRTNKIRCPNQLCASHTKKDDNIKNEVIYFRYDDNSLKYIYICTICDKMWKTSEE